MKTLNQFVGERLLARREALGYTQDQVSEATGITRTTILNIEKGKHAVLMANLYRIALHYNLEIADLLPPFAELASALMGEEVAELVQQKSPENLRKMLVGFL